jgi:hypothetical protein
MEVRDCQLRCFHLRSMSAHSNSILVGVSILIALMPLPTIVGRFIVKVQKGKMEAVRRVHSHCTQTLLS